MARLIDETGKEYGRLTVLRRASPSEIKNNDGRAYWVCKCSCGNIVIVSGRNLRRSTQSCGCLQKELAKKSISNYIQKIVDNLTGQRFGRLIALYPTDKRKNGSIIWYCKCDCGNFAEVSSDCLVNGKTKSCGCFRKELGSQKLAKWGENSTETSLGEKKIIQILSIAKVAFVREKQFLDDDKIKNYRYDFFLPELNICCEYNGEQHYHFSTFFHKNRSDFTKAQERDRRKISYCLAHGIRIYCIPYWEINNLYTVDDLFQEKFLARTKFHNDIVFRQQNR